MTVFDGIHKPLPKLRAWQATRRELQACKAIVAILLAVVAVACWAWGGA